MRLSLLAFVAMVGCVSRAAPALPPGGDHAAPAPSVACLTACNTLIRVGCAEGAEDCPRILQKISDWRTTRDRVDGYAVTCDTVLQWQSRDDVSKHTFWTCSPISYKEHGVPWIGYVQGMQPAD